MIRTLPEDEVETVLRSEVVGRIGCSVNGHPYVVPVSYVYADGAIYAHSGEGLKLRMMRQNRDVCFEVDHIEDLVNWHSVICWATYEELQGAEAAHALQLLRQAVQQRLPGVVQHREAPADASTTDAGPTVFRLLVTEKTGREDRLYWQLLANGTNGTAPTERHGVRPADSWLSHPEAVELAKLSSVLDADGVWQAADQLALGHAADTVVHSLVYQGADEPTAQEIIGYLVELRDEKQVITT